MAMTEADKVTRYGPVVCRMNSVSQPEKVYEVRYLDGKYSCGCKGWIFKKRCRHTIYAEEHSLISTNPLYKIPAGPDGLPGTSRVKKPVRVEKPATLAREMKIIDELLTIAGLMIGGNGKPLAVRMGSGITPDVRRRMADALTRHLAATTAAPTPEAAQDDAPIVYGGVRLITLDS